MSSFISRLMAALKRWFAARSQDDYGAKRKSAASRRLEYDAYIRNNARDDRS